MQTVRRAIIEILSTGEYGALALSKILRISEKEVYAHLDHIGRSVRSQEKKLAVTPARCLECGFVFESRNRLTKPGKCPRCRGEHIEDPRYRVV
jgi:transcriptional regulator